MDLIEKISHVEKYVEDIEFSTSFYQKKLGFNLIAKDNRNSPKQSLLLQNGSALLQLTSSTTSSDPIYQHVKMHGDSIKNIAFQVKNVQACFESALKNNATCILPPQVIADGRMVAKFAKIRVFNYLEHSFWELDSAPHLPFFDYLDMPIRGSNFDLLDMDHIAMCHQPGTIEEVVTFYKKAFLFEDNRREDIHSGISGMKTVVVESPNGNVKFPMVEPMSISSPLYEYLNHNGGAGVHHIAFGTNNITGMVEKMLLAGLQFKKTPESYYRFLKKRNLSLEVDIEELARLSILVDLQENGYLMQIFSKPVSSRPTYFIELIQRMGVGGFGSGNIKALYDSLEQERAVYA